MNQHSINLEAKLSEAEQSMDLSFKDFCKTNTLSILTFSQHIKDRYIFALLFIASSLIGIKRNKYILTSNSFWPLADINGFEDERESILARQKKITWTFLFQSLEESTCKILYLYYFTFMDGSKLAKKLPCIKFPCLKELCLSTDNIDNVQFISFKNLPFLQSLDVTSNRFFNIRSLRKACIPQIDQLQIQKNYIKEYQSLSQLRISKQKPFKLKTFSSDQSEMEYQKD